VKPPRRSGGYAAAEDDRDLVRAPERQLIRKGALKPRPTGRGAVKHPRVGDLSLAKGQLVAVAAGAVLGGERRGERGLPAVKNACTSAADRLEQISASADWSSQAANPSSSALNGMSRWVA
jgi:hypothetical protein